jgi:hypothetical protein
MTNEQLHKLEASLQLGDTPYYEGFNITPHKNSLRAGGVPFDGIYEHFIKMLKPSLILEIGSYLGYSAVQMAKEVKRLELKNTKIICIDTWLGSVDYYFYNRDPKSVQGRKDFGYENGYPTLYHKFLSNVIESEMQDVIRPFPFPSTIAAKILKKVLVEELKIQPEIIFVDGCHEEYDVFFDCFYYYDILKEGGVMWGDDWTWESVRNGVMRFVNDNGLHNKFNVMPNQVSWYITK